MTKNEQIINRNIGKLLRHAFELQPRENQEKMLESPGTSMKPVGESLEFEAAGIVYAVVDRKSLANPEFDVNDGEFVAEVNDISELDDC